MTVTGYSGPGSPGPLVPPGPGSRAGSQHRSFRLDLSRQVPCVMVRRAGTPASVCVCVCVCQAGCVREPHTHSPAFFIVSHWVHMLWDSFI